MATLEIDGREPPEVFAAFKDEDHVRINLDVGDFIIYSENENKKPRVVVERKAWADLASSLTSPRFDDQSARLRSFCEAHDARPVYVIEEENVRGWEGKTGSLSNKFMDCCIHKLAVEGFTVLRTKNVQHTAQTVSWLLKRCREGKEYAFQPNMKLKNGGNAAGVKFKKSENLTPQKTWENMLTAIHGVSAAKAKEIAKKHPRPDCLIEHYKTTKKSKLDVKGIGKKTEDKIMQIFTSF